VIGALYPHPKFCAPSLPKKTNGSAIVPKCENYRQFGYKTLIENTV